MASYNLGKVVGDDGVSLEYDWEGTSLGIKREDEAEYTYVDLKGDTGATGSTGASGSDGYSPTVQTSKEGKTTTIEITDKNGTHTATIQDGADGSNGIDGTSPTASVSKSGNTATITITDKNGTTTTTVSDGTNGTNGRDGYVQYTAGSNISIDNNVISATDTTYSAGSNISITNGEISADLSSKQDIIQYSTMPTASSTNAGSIVQFVGTTDTNYTNGYFYQCVEDDGVYSWENIQVQTGGSITQNIPIWECTANSTYDFIPSNMVGYGLEYNKWYLAGNDFKAKASAYGTNNEFVNKNDLFKVLNINTSNTYYYFIHIGSGGLRYSSGYDPVISIWKRSSRSGVDKVISTKTLLNDYASVGTGYTEDTTGTNYNALSTSNTKAFTPISGSYNPSTAIYTEKMVEAIAPVYSNSSTYDVGDYVSLKGKLYVCNTTISTAENWTSAHWTETTAMSVIGNINTILNSLVTVGGGN